MFSHLAYFTYNSCLDLTSNFMKKYRDLILIPLIFGLVWLGLRWYRTPGVKHGQQSPDFVGYLANGDSMRLSDLEGQVVLLDFWGSWCGPCRKANRDLVDLYQVYKNAEFEDGSKGFTILSVGIETDKQAWLNAIEKDGLVWPHHVSDLERFSDRVALLYGIREIPSTFLLNGQREVLAVNAAVPQLRATLERLKKK